MHYVSWSTSELWRGSRHETGLSPPVKWAVLLLWITHVICGVCLLRFHVRLFIVALWSPAGKGLTSWLSFVMSYCEFVILSEVWYLIVSIPYLCPLSYLDIYHFIWHTPLIEYYLPRYSIDTMWFCLFDWVDSLRHISNLSVKKGRVFLCWTSTKLGYIKVSCSRTTTQWRRWGSNPRHLGFESSPLPLSHCAP